MVSVIIPCYNQGHYLKESVRSVLAQSYEDWECIIVNDGSADDTEAIAKELCAADSRIKYISKANGGLSSARNAGIKAAGGAYILPLDADDLIMPAYLQKTVKVLDEEKAIGIAYCGTQLFGTESGVRNEPFSLQQCLVTNLIPCTALYKKQDWESAGGYNEAMRSGYEDWDFWISMLEKGVQVRKLPELLFQYRRTASSMSKEMTEETISNIKAAVFNRHKDFFIEVLGNSITLADGKNELQRQLDLIKNSGSYRLAEKIGSLSKIFRKKGGHAA